MTQDLINGAAEFKRYHYEGNEALMESLVESGQDPRYFIISCIDSRCNPGTIFRAKPGTFFAHKAMGAIIRPYHQGTALAAALQFALNYNNVGIIIVLGHTQCGAIKALAEDIDDPEIRWVTDRIERFNADDVIRMIQFGHPFKVVDEEIPPELPGPETRRYANVSNAVVDKADKKSNKAMAKAEKDTLVPTQTKEQRNTWLEDSEWAQEKRKEKEDSDRLLKIHKEREARYQMQQRKMREAQAKDKKDQNKDPVGKQHEGTDTWNPDPEKDKVTKHQARQLPSTPKIPIKKPRKSNVDFKDLRPQFGEDSQDLPGLGSSKKARRTSKRVGQLYTGAQVEVAPPGWGHTKAEKEKTKPNKPKSKIGGSAHEFDKDLKSGKFKGLPGDKTMKDKKASMFKIMWSAHNKDDEPHYEPGKKDKLKPKYKKDENVLDSAKRYLDNG